MKWTTTILIAAALCGAATVAEPLGFRPLFDGETLDGWVNVNTGPDTWSVKDGLLVCNGTPIGVMRSDRQYENFVLEIEWMHLEAGGNSGVFVWSEGEVTSANRLPSGVEVQMLELEYPKIHNRVQAYVSGELFGADYEFLDESVQPVAISYYYLEDISLLGGVTRHPPAVLEYPR